MKAELRRREKANRLTRLLSPETGGIKDKKEKKQLDAIALLKADHRKVDDHFKKFEKAPKSRKAELVAAICTELKIHTAIEEDVFYPACRAKGVKGDLLDEAQVEHDGAKLLIQELENAAPSDPFYDAKVKVLSEYIKHHVAEEEQRGGLFAQAKKRGVDLKGIGQRLKARKDELEAGAKAGRLHDISTPSRDGIRSGRQHDDLDQNDARDSGRNRGIRRGQYGDLPGSSPQQVQQSSESAQYSAQESPDRSQFGASEVSPSRGRTSARGNTVKDNR